MNHCQFTQLEVSAHSPHPPLFWGLSTHQSAGFKAAPNWFNCCGGSGSRHHSKPPLLVGTAVVCQLNQKLSRLKALAAEHHTSITATNPQAPSSTLFSGELPRRLSFKTTTYQWLVAYSHPATDRSQLKGHWIQTHPHPNWRDPWHLAALFIWHSPLHAAVLALHHSHQHLDLKPYLTRDVWIVFGLEHLHRSRCRHLLELIISLAHKTLKPLWVVSSSPITPNRPTPTPRSAPLSAGVNNIKPRNISQYVSHLKQQPPWYFMSSSVRAQWQEITQFPSSSHHDTGDTGDTGDLG